MDALVLYLPWHKMTFDQSNDGSNGIRVELMEWSEGKFMGFRVKFTQHEGEQLRDWLMGKFPIREKGE